MLSEIPPEIPSIGLQFLLDRGIFNLVRLCAKTKTTLYEVRELQYADDNATPDQTTEDLQSLADAYNSACERFRMQVNTEKIKTLVQHSPGQTPTALNITINN